MKTKLFYVLRFVIIYAGIATAQDITGDIEGKIVDTLGISLNEVEVKAGGFEAEFTSALGGVVNVITNSGSNDFHGSFFGLYTGNGFTTDKQLGLLDPTQGKFSDYDAGFSLGGPVIRDHLWFLTAYNPTFSNHEVSIPDFGIGVDPSLRHSFAAKLNWSTLPQMRLDFTITGEPSTSRGNEIHFEDYTNNNNI